MGHFQSFIEKKPINFNNIDYGKIIQVIYSKVI